MKHQKLLNLLSDAKDSKFVTRKWIFANDQSSEKYGKRNKIIYNIEVLKSNHSNYNDAYFLVKDDIIVTGAPETQVSYKLMKKQ